MDVVVAAVFIVPILIWNNLINCMLGGGICGIGSGVGIKIGCNSSSLAHYHPHN